ncbi:MAG: hypothetical protein EPN56_03795 [Rhodanobacter sp.]|nr:MAG: hypothetical protein EPN78_08450 [Rhodanobacter sp.]TAM08773.1 MAG: hypothetical protein EPN66_11885 [Rhodanobacter sp.]TAM36815.1 MAG: hypothetical protein EPN56_03795 [Rhodanobacter sp.]
MFRSVLAVLLCAPLAALAAPCKYEAPRHLQLDLAGVRGVQLEVRSFDLHVKAAPGTRQLQLNGRACASEASMLDRLQVNQRREGDQLIVTLGGDRSGSGSGFNLFGASYASLDVSVQLPPEMPTTVRVGSGDAWVSGLQQLASIVGSGNLHVSNISGAFSTSVGSGDVDANGVGSLKVGAVGSGDLKAQGVKGEANVGAIGSGDVKLRDIGGNVRVDTIGSGDLVVNGVGGSLSVGAKGSGDVNYSSVRGKVDVPRADD